MNIIIRHAQLEDAHIIAEAERQIAQTPGFFCSEPHELTDENVANTILSFLKDNKGVYLVAENEGLCLVGHAFLKPYDLKALRHVADLNIAVHLNWQGKGIGKKLLQKVIEWAKNSSSIEKIQLNVRASNATAISLYKKMGFQEEGRLKNRIKVKDQYIDDIVMGLETFSESP
jgi:RimJ/RimL family protein N-acetyltransferase